MSNKLKENSEDMLMTFMGTGDEGFKTLVMVLNHTKVFKADLKPEEVEARNAGMRIIYDMLGGKTDASQQKLLGALIKGLGGVYDEYKHEFRRDSINDSKGDK
jgi:hypothetical protein